MCLIFIAHKHSAGFPLVVAANRDEFHTRPTAPAAFWNDAPEILAGRDLDGGGTWFGVTRNGRFAAVTNFREAGANRADAPTRGVLVSDFLRGGQTPMSYLDDVAGRGAAYNGFNLIAGDLEQMGWYSNRGDGTKALPPGIYGISNHLLDTPWPKVVRGKSAFGAWLADDNAGTDRLLDMLGDRTVADDASLPDTGIGRDGERVLSPMFISGEGYGTRSSTVLTVDAAGRTDFAEVSYAPDGSISGRVALKFDLEPVNTARLEQARATAG